VKYISEESWGELREIYKFLSFRQSKSVNNVCKLLQLLGDLRHPWWVVELYMFTIKICVLALFYALAFHLLSRNCAVVHNHTRRSCVLCQQILMWSKIVLYWYFHNWASAVRQLLSSHISWLRTNGHARPVSNSSLNLICWDYMYKMPVIYSFLFIYN